MAFLTLWTFIRALRICFAVWEYVLRASRSDFSKNLAEGQAAEDAAVEAYAPDLVCDKLR